MSPRARIGLVEDDPIMGESIAHRLDLEGYAVTWWKSGQVAASAARADTPDLVVCDIRLPDMSGEALFSKLIPEKPGLPFIFITGFAQVDQAVRLMRAGAADYVAKPFAMTDFLDKVSSLLQGRMEAEQVLGQSPAMTQVEQTLRRIADIESTVLLSGESGVGKEVAARFLHAESERAEGPFVAVNCAAIPADLLESELFGHERGAFTGAAGRHLGYVERAGRGVLFLDEIGEMPLGLQAKLLRLIETRRFQRLGGESELQCHARIVCATNIDLDSAVRQGCFRADLLFRIRVIDVRIPPLRERPEDVRALLDLFRAQFSSAFGRHIAGFHQEAIEMALIHDWPGNVRELKNRVERAIALADGSWIGKGQMFPDLAPPSVSPADFATLASMRERVERQHIKSALERTEGRVDEAARLLDVSRSTLFDKMKRLRVGHPG